MPISTRAWYRGPSSYGLFPPGVKWLLILNTAVFVASYFAAVAGYPNIFLPFALIPAWVLKGAVWQLFTYMFLHAGFQHILFNMLSLWWFGVMLEQTWGTRRFLNFYFLCGVGAGICVVLGNLVFGGNLLETTVGASGAIYGVLMAFGMLFPETEILFMFLFPVKAKYFVMIMGAIEFMLSFAGSGGGVSHVAHLGGMFFGYLYIKNLRSKRARVSFSIPISQWYHDYKLRRAKKKFQVYLKKRQSDQDRWVH